MLILTRQDVARTSGLELAWSVSGLRWRAAWPVRERSAGLPGHEQDGVEGPPGHRDVVEAGGGQRGQVLLDHRQRLVVAVSGAVLLRRDHRRARVPQSPVPGAG